LTPRKPSCQPRRGTPRRRGLHGGVARIWDRDRAQSTTRERAMLLTIVILCAAFAALIAMLAYGYREAERDRERPEGGPLASVPTAREGHCVVCDALLRRPSTGDEVVCELEHRIDAELRDISRVLQTAPGSVGRLYRAKA
jgi:hypothetical protein